MAMITPRIHSGVTLRKIEATPALESAWAELQAAIARGASETTRELGNKGGSIKRSLYVRDDLRIWMSKELLLDRGYFWLPFGTLPMKESGNLNMVVQLNRAPKYLGSSVAGLLAVDARNDRWICHSGRIGGGRTGIGRSAFLAWTPRPAVTVIDEDGRTDVALPIARLGDARMDAAMAEFVREVESFKSKPAAKPPESSVNFGGMARELEGSSVVASREGYEMTRTHAIVRNLLADLIEAAGQRIGRDTQRDLFVGDPDRPDFEFEVKPCADPQSIYTAGGQLLVHGVSKPASRRVAVLPHTLGTSHAAALRQLGIDLIAFRLTDREIVFEGLTALIPEARQSAPLI